MDVWKCYRCNFIYKEKLHADLHVGISNHPLRKIEFPSLASN